MSSDVLNFVEPVPFDSDPETGWTLPARTYFDPNWFERERRLIFQRSWHCVGHQSQIENPGAYVTHTLVDQPVFVMRNQVGELVAFHNVCRHRAHLVLQGVAGRLSSKLMTCPYHGWSYDETGALRAAPHCETIKDFDMASFSLPPVRVETFQGFVFVNLDMEAPSLQAGLDGLGDALTQSFPGLETWKPAGQSVFDIRANWKNIGDNFLECYHCHVAHKAFVDLVEMKTYKVKTHELWSSQIGRTRKTSAAYDTEGGKAEGYDNFHTYFIWPNLGLVAFPGTEAIATFQFVPTGPETTRQVFEILTPTGEMDEIGKRALDYFNDVLGPEDVKLVETVQRGLHSVSYDRGRFMVDPDRSFYAEHCVHHFHGLVVKSMASEH